MLKKTTAILLTLLLIGSLVGCQQSAADTTASLPTAQSSDVSTQTSDAAANPFVSDSTTSEETASSSSAKTSAPDNSTVDASAVPPSESSGNANGFDPNGNQGNSGFQKNRGGRFGDNSDMTPPDMPTDGNGSFTPPEMPDGDSGSFTPPDMPSDSGNTAMPFDRQNGGGMNNSGSTNVTSTVSTASLQASDLFSDRDLTQTADTSEAVTIQVSSGKTETITKAGVYILSGTATDFTVKVAADKEDKVQLVLDGLNVTNSSTPVIYVTSADKCFITTTSQEISLSVTDTFTADDDTNTDAVIYSKDDVVFNGTGTLTIHSAQGNGISGKDDVKFTGGTYNITSKLDSVEANDSIRIYDGTFTIDSSKDAFHSEDSDDDTVGYLYILNGTFNIKASSDAIQGATLVQIDGGTFTLTSPEGIEGTYIRINGGNISITSSDDGINATYKSRSCGTPTVEINDGNLTIVMGQGDTDAIDANGNIIVNGGTINITAQMSSFDYDGTAAYNGGTIIINGQQVDSIPQSMMGGGRGGMGNMGGRGGMGW